MRRWYPDSYCKIKEFYRQTFKIKVTDTEQNLATLNVFFLEAGNPLSLLAFLHHFFILSAKRAQTRRSIRANFIPKNKTITFEKMIAKINYTFIGLNGVKNRIIYLIKHQGFY